MQIVAVISDSNFDYFNWRHVPIGFYLTEATRRFGQDFYPVWPGAARLSVKSPNGAKPKSETNALALAIGTSDIQVYVYMYIATLNI